MKYFIHKNAIVETKNIGEETKVWDFCNILSGARIGKNCNICHGSFIEGEVVVGDNVTIKNNVSLWNGITVENDVFIGPDVSFTNDLYPRSRNKNFEEKKTLLKRGCSIGANATILPGITIGEYALIGAGAVVTKDVPAFSLSYGNPARTMGKVDKEGNVIR